MISINGDIDSVLYEQPGQSVLNQIENNIGELSALSGLSSMSRSFIGGMKSSFDRSFGLASIISRKDDIQRSLGSLDTEINYFGTPKSMLTLNDLSMRLAMANPRAKRSYLAGDISAWDGEYAEESLDVGKHDYNFRRATDGVIYKDQVSDEVFSVNYFENYDIDDKLDIFDKSLVQSMWETMNQGFDINFDITNPFSAGDF